MSATEGRTPAALVLAPAGPTLTDEERAFFRELDPYGFILFRRNATEPAQVRALIAELRESVGRPAPILVDQEGGRVQRLGPPHWRRYPPAGAIGSLWRVEDPVDAASASFFAARLIAHDLASLGFTHVCAPVLDLRVPGADETVMGDRTYHAEPEAVAFLGRSAAEGFASGGIVPIHKHTPGHGRATVDSHKDLPRVTARLIELDQTDFHPFRALASPDQPHWDMVAHIVFTALDADRPASLSPRVIAHLRQALGLAGPLIADDLGMGALTGPLADRIAGCLAAGCDLALHCTGDLAEMRALAAAATPLTPEAAARLARAAPPRPEPFDPRAAWAELTRLLAPVWQPEATLA